MNFKLLLLMGLLIAGVFTIAFFTYETLYQEPETISIQTPVGCFPVETTPTQHEAYKKLLGDLYKDERCD